MTAASLLMECWDCAERLSSQRRPLGLLLPTVQGLDIDLIAALPVGRLDARLLDLRRRLFGEGMEALAHCPACGLTFELTFSVADVKAARPPGAVHRVAHGGWAIDFRLPDSRDMHAAAKSGGVDEARRVLIRRCVMNVTRRSRRRPVDEVPEELIEQMEEVMAGADPQADFRLKLRCPSCQVAWDADLDVGAFVTAEVSAGALRLLRDVHRLAAAYGWSDAEVLNLAPYRRRAYLELVSGE